MWVLWAVLCLNYFTESQMTVDIIYSSFTDSDFTSNLTVLLQKNLQDQFSFNWLCVENIVEIQNIADFPAIIFDITSSLVLSNSIKELAEEKHIIIVKGSKPAGEFSNWEFFTHNSLEDQFEALTSIISYLNWKTFIVISDEIYNKGNYFQKLDCQWFYFSSSNSENSTDLFIGKTIQPSGIRNIVILNKGESTKFLLKSMEKHNLIINGTGIITGSESSWDLYGSGIIAYTESGLEAADSYYNYEGLALIKFLELILSFSSDLDSLELLEYLSKNTVHHHPLSNFTLLNTKNSQKITSGNILNGNLTITNTLIYPGNSSIIPNSPTTSVNIWIADGTTNPGAPSELLATTVTSAEFFAISIWKNSHTLDGFEITVTDTDCGVMIYDAAFAYSCFSKLIDTPGVGYLTSLYPWMAIGYILTLRSLNYSMPHISPYAPSSISQNITTFPEFMSVIKDEAFNTQVILNLAVIFGWKNFVVIYDETNTVMYNYFLSKIKEFNMNIINPPELRKIDTYYTREDFPKWKYWFEGIIKLRARLMVGFLTPPYWMYISESFYDAGIRRGDFMFLANARVAYSLEWETDPDQRNKLIDLLYGGIVVAQAEWFGDYGQMIRNEYIKQYSNDTDFRCLCFDSAMLLLNGIEFTIKKGQNVNDYEVINANLRKQKFLGCSGTVSIESGSNQRSLPTIGIHNLKWDESSQKIYEELIGIYDLSSAQLITFYKEIIWYDNTTNVPTDKVGYDNGCPFPKRKIIRSEKGAGIFYVISIFLIIISIIESFYLWKKFWSYLFIGRLVVPVLAQFEDYILMSLIVVDFFQFISQGPDISGWNEWFSLLCGYSMMNFDYSVSGNAYWAYLYAAIGISCYWIFVGFLLFYRLNKQLAKMLRHIKNISLLLLPLIGNIGFMPIVSVLLSIFQCDQGISSNITDSFIRQDCNTYCWGNNFKVLGVISIFSLVTYIPLSIYFRHYFENINENTNIKTKPLFIIEKSIFQLIFVVMSKTTKVYHQSFHGLCCIILFTIFISLCYMQRPYNYHRMNLWLIVSYFSILWSFILSSIYWLTEFDSIIWLTLEFSAFCLFIAVGIAIQCKWYSSLLYTEKPLDIAIFFKFLLGNKITAFQINRMKKELIESKFSSNLKASNMDTHSVVITTKAIMISE